MKRTILASLLGSLVVFAWGFLSWEIIGWHAPQQFKNPTLVSQTLQENAPSHGLYMLPGMKDQGPDAEALSEGPFVYATVRPGKLPATWSFGQTMAKSYAIGLAGCLIIAVCVYRIRAHRYISRASIGFTLGLFAAVSTVLPHRVWFELSDTHLLANFVDPIAGYTLAGLVIAAVIKPRGPRRIFS